MPLASLRSTILALVLGVVCGWLWKPISRVEETQAEDENISLAVFMLETPVKPVPLNCRDRRLRLAFTVMSTSDNKGATKRSLVRGSWPRRDIYKPPPAVNVTLKFVLGTKNLPQDQIHKLKAELDEFKDILLLPNHNDTYYQLTEKVRQAVQWADKNLQFDYLIKTDDDVIIRLDKMVAALRKMGCPERLYWGRALYEIWVKKSGKWKEMKWNTCFKYLPYYSGAAYVMARQVVRSVMKYSEHLSCFTCEDVSMAFWVSPYNITRHDDSRFYGQRTCSNKAIQSHYGDELQNFKRALHAMKTKGRLC